MRTLNGVEEDVGSEADKAAQAKQNDERSLWRGGGLHYWQKANESADK